MKYILETTRLRLREMTPADAENAYNLNLDPEVIRYTGDPPFGSVDEARKFLEAYDQYEKYGYGRWAVELKATGEYTGWCGLKYNEKGLTDLGYRFMRKYWGQGIATEAAGACLDYGFRVLNLEMIVGRVMPENIASVKVLENIGLKYWKKDECKGMDNALYYKLDKEEYLNR